MLSSDNPLPQIGVIGLGEMGAAMAKRLIGCGFCVHGYDIDPAAYGRVPGITIAGDLAMLAFDGKPLLIMVDTSQQLVDVAHELLAHLHPDQIVIASSTIDHWAVVSASERITTARGAYIDAPVSGGASSALKGQLAIAVGCETQAYARARPIFDALCGYHCHIGGIGEGFATKMVNNLIFHITSVGVAEVMTLAAHQGCNPDRLLAALQKGAGDSMALRARAPRYLSRDFSGVPMRIAYREILMELELAKRAAHVSPLGEVTRHVHELAMDKGLGGQEGAALIKIYEHQEGVRLARPPLVEEQK